MTSDVMEHLFSNLIIYSFEKLRQNYTATEIYIFFLLNLTDYGRSKNADTYFT